MAIFWTVNLWDKILRWYRGTVLYELVEHFVQVFFTVRPVSYEKITLTVTAAKTVRNAILAVALGVILAAAGIFYTRRYPGGFVRKLLAAGAHSPEKAMTLAETGYFYSVGVRLNLKRGGVLTKTVVRAGDPEPPVPLELREETAEPATEEAPNEEPATEETGAEETATVEETAADGADVATGEAVTDGANEANGANEADGAEQVTKPFDFVNDRFYIPEGLRYRAEVRYTQKGSGVLPLVLTVVLTIVGSGLLCRFLPDILRLADWLL